VPLGERAATLTGVALSTGTLLKRGMHRRCPVCGAKKLFRRWVQMADDCPQCGLHFQRVPGQWLGSWFINICLAQVLVIGIVLGGSLASYPRPQIVPIAICGGLAMVVFPFGFFPYSRTLWLAIDLAMRPLEFDEGVDPGWELDADRAALDSRRD